MKNNFLLFFNIELEDFQTLIIANIKSVLFPIQSFSNLILIFYFNVSEQKIPLQFHELFSLIFAYISSKYRKTPLLVPGVDPFSNANIYVLDHIIAETKTNLESKTCPLLSPILHQVSGIQIPYIVQLLYNIVQFRFLAKNYSLY